ncbi:MAG: FAD-binding oxidoreductase [Salaquimonas sp.]
MVHHVQSGPINLDTLIRFNDPIADEVDVVVIGGGIIGVTAALYLIDEGLSVAIVEKGRMACEQSSRNWGWIRQHGRDADELPIMMEANRLWGELDNQTKNRTGFTRGGIMYLASSEEKMAVREKWVAIAKEHQLDTRILSRKEVAEHIDQGNGSADSAYPNNAHKWVGATFTPSDARAEAWQAVPALSELAQSKGVLISENCAARTLEITAGAVTGVVTERGTIKCSQIVLAAGAWSSLFLQRHGVSIPQLSVRSSVSSTGPMAKVFGGNAADETIAFRRREDGGYNISLSNYHDLYLGPDAFRNFFKWLPVATEHWRDTKLRPMAPGGFPDGWRTRRKWSEDEESPFEQTRVLEPQPNMNKLEELRSEFAKRFPNLGKPRITHSWGGMIDAMPDIVPIVDHIPQLGGVILATGMSGHGFGIGPGFGKIIAKMAAGKPVGHDMSRFRFSRFTDGSKMRPGPAI